MREAHNSKFKIQNDNNKNGWQFAPSELSTIFLKIFCRMDLLL